MAFVSAGATVGKMRGMDRAMRGGFGTASITLESGLTVAAAVAVNAVGDIIDPASGEVIAGARGPDGTGFVDMRRALRGEGVGGSDRESAGQPTDTPGAAPNTTIGVVITDAEITKVEAKQIAVMAHDGFARALYPVHTPGDGDLLFVLSTGEKQLDREQLSLLSLGTTAANTVARAIAQGVHSALTQQEGETR